MGVQVPSRARDNRVFRFDEGPCFSFVSVEVDTIEQMFEHSSMAPAITLEGAPPARAAVEALQQRIHAMEVTKMEHRVFPVSPAVSSLFPEGGLSRGAIYQVDSSSSLLWALLAQPSTRGTWCALVGMPDMGLAAAEEMGVNVDRLVLVPYPGQQWFSVLAALIDVVGIVALGSLPAPSDRILSTLTGRLREREATLLVRNDWPRTEASIQVRHQWSGITQGRGMLDEHRVLISATPRHGHPVRTCEILVDAWGTHEVSRHAAVTDIAAHRQAG